MPTQAVSFWDDFSMMFEMLYPKNSTKTSTDQSSIVRHSNSEDGSGNVFFSVFKIMNLLALEYSHLRRVPHRCGVADGMSPDD